MIDVIDENNLIQRLFMQFIESTHVILMDSINDRYMSYHTFTAKHET